MAITASRQTAFLLGRPLRAGEPSADVLLDFIRDDGLTGEKEREGERPAIAVALAAPYAGGPLR